MKKNRSVDENARNKAMEIYHRFSDFSVFSLPDEHLLAINFVEILIEKDWKYQVMHDYDENTVTYFW